MAEQTKLCPFSFGQNYGDKVCVGNRCMAYLANSDKCGMVREDVAQKSVEQKTVEQKKG